MIAMQKARLDPQLAGYGPVAARGEADRARDLEDGLLASDTAPARAAE